VAVGDWGYPGYLTRQEWDVFQQFKADVERRPPQFQSTVYCFQAAAEDPSHALCRWLRARKFHLSEAVAMVAQATAVRSRAGCPHFYPDGHLALGVEPSVYHTQYPQMYYGYARGGHPLFISRVGQLNAEGMACITTMDGILHYHWHDMMHSYIRHLDRQRLSNPHFKRYEVVCIIDLDGLTTSHLTKRALDIVKAQTEVDSLCFPETLRHLVIINAPGFFAMTWKLISKWIDARTVNKITILGNNRTKWVAKLKEFVDPDQLPVDYGGTGISIERYLEKETVEQYTAVHSRQKRTEEAHRNYSQPSAGFVDDDDDDADDNIPRTSSFCPKTLAVGQIVSQKAYHFSVRSSASHHASVLKEESMELSVFTRSVTGGTLRITSPSGAVVTTVPVRHKGKGREQDDENDPPTRLDLDVVLTRPGRYKFKIESNGGSLFGTEDFVLVTRVFGTTTDDHHLRLAASNSGNLDIKPSDSSADDLGNFVDVTLCNRRFCKESGDDARATSPMVMQGRNNSMLDIDLSTDERAQEELPPLHPRDIGSRKRASLSSRPQSPDSAAGSTGHTSTNKMEDRQPSPSGTVGVSDRNDRTEEIEDEERGMYCTGMSGMLCGALGGSTASLSTFFDLLCGGGSADALGRTDASAKDAHPVPTIATTSTEDEEGTGNADITTMASF